MRKFYVLFILWSFIGLACSSTVNTLMYSYRAVNEDCNCEEYHTRDRKHNVEYSFRAHYKMNDGIFTTIDVGISNRSNDTLILGLGTVKVSSRNISYQYNNKPVPLPSLIILPHDAEDIQLTGKSLEREENWHRIAGERMEVTLQGLRLGNSILPSTTVIFIPENPKLGR